MEKHIKVDLPPNGHIMLAIGSETLDGEQVFRPGVQETGVIEGLKSKVADLASASAQVAIISGEAFISGLVSFMKVIHNSLNDIGEARPSRFQLEFGIEATVDADIRICSTNGKGAIKVIAEWNSK